MMMTEAQIARLFTGPDGSYRFARWGRPIVPVVFGLQDSTLAVVKGAIEAIVTLANHKMAETDPELGANLMVFFLRDWQELAQLPHLAQMIPDLGAVVARLQAADAPQYRAFRFDQTGAIRASFVFVRMAGAQAELPAGDIALDIATRAILTWAPTGTTDAAPGLLARNTQGAAVLRPEIAALIRAAYDPVMPAAADDASHALRLLARLPTARKEQE